MPRYTKEKEKEIKTIQKLVLKFGKNIRISNENAIGTVNIVVLKNFQKTMFFDCVDIKIEFDGILLLQEGKRVGWYESTVKSKTSSPIVINRYIKRSVFKEVKMFLKYFSISILDCTNIKKVEWVEK